jgi:hypothetical protein
MFHTCYRIVADLLQNTEFLFCFCTVSLGWSRTNFHVLWPPKQLVAGNLRTDCFWTEFYDLWENRDYCRGSFPRKPNCLHTNLTAYHGKSDSIFANRVHPVSLLSTTLSPTFLLELNFLASLACCLFHALYMIYKSVQHPQMHSSTIIQGRPKVGIQYIVYVVYSILYTYFWPTQYISVLISSCILERSFLSHVTLHTLGEWELGRKKCKASTVTTLLL